MTGNGPVLRIFEVRTKPGAGAELLAKFKTTSAEVVEDQPGNLGYFFGEFVEEDNAVAFVSIWENLDAIKKRFGSAWQESFLPPGYEALIEKCSIRHLDAGAGWNLDKKQ